MAAEQQSGRVCQCGCGRPIERKRKNAVLRIDCRARRDSQLHAARHAVRRKKQNEERLALNQCQRRSISRVSWRDDPNRRQALCRMCFGMPWARAPYRYNESTAYALIPVSDESMRCSGCGEPWAPEPPVALQDTLSSSAGMVARHGDLHSINFNTDWGTKGKQGVKSKYGR